MNAKWLISLAVVVSSPRAIAQPAPTKEQVAALAELQRDAAVYESNARDYRSAISRIVQHHYEAKRRAILRAFDASLLVEKRGLAEARDDAIAKLERFVASYEKSPHPEATPDAMFRLAALYEERGRASDDAMIEKTSLDQAIALYTRITRDFGSYREIAGVHYHLGHALEDAGRSGEAEQVFRSLVCHDRYPTIANALPKKDATVFVNPYPPDCRALPQPVARGEEPRYVAEVWWILGDRHFNAGAATGPFEYACAEAAYRHALELKKEPVHAVAAYKLAWTLYKEQRYEASVRAFVDLLHEMDDEQKKTGDPGADFRQEATTYIASSLTFVDLRGPDADAPFSPRDDVLDTEKDARVAEQKMRVGIDRVQDTALIPQKEAWTVDLYRALADEYRDLDQMHSAIEVLELVLAKWPMHGDAPVVQDRIAQAYDTLASRAREGTPEREDDERRALEARSKLAAYTGTKPWVQANLGDAEALETAERLVRGGLRRAAADHTNAGSALVDRALAAADTPDRGRLFDRALAEYRLAAEGWAGYLEQADERSASDAYESRYWLADAHHRIVVILLAEDKTPTPAEIEASLKTAGDVRDSNEDDRYVQPGAFLAVDTAQRVLDHAREPRRAVKTEQDGDRVKVIKEALPPEVLAAVAARDAYVKRVPPEKDVPAAASAMYQNRDLYAVDAADFFFSYGDFDEAKSRFSPLYGAFCGKNELGHRAWVRLITMANLTGDVASSKKLADAVMARSCAIDALEKKEEEALARGSRSRVDYADAAAAFARAEKMPDGPDRTKAYREAAALYKSALDRAPADESAPGAALEGAHCYEQAGDYDEAIALYERLIDAYGSEETLAAIEKRDPKAYEDRVKKVKLAYDALSRSYALFFDFRGAAGTLDRVAESRRFERSDRRDAAKNAAIIYESLGERDRLAVERQRFDALEPSPADRAEMDFLLARAEKKAWDEKAPDEGKNRAARLAAMAAMDAFVDVHDKSAEAAAFVVRAAHASAELRRAGGDPKGAATWCQRATAAFQRYRLHTGTEAADLAAECAFRAIDRKLYEGWDLDTGHHAYVGVIDAVKRSFDQDFTKASDVWTKELQAVITTYGSRRWSIAARARQASVFLAIRTGLFNAREPGLRLYSSAEEQKLRAAEASGREDLLEIADKFRQTRVETWRRVRAESLEKADRAMVRFATEAWLWSRAFKVKSAASDDAARRLASVTDLIGDAKVREYTDGLIDPATKKPFSYEDGMFSKTRVGLPADASPVMSAEPVPAAVR